MYELSIGGVNVGSRKQKLNFSILKGCRIGVVISGHRNKIGLLESARLVGDQYVLSFENGYILKIQRNVMLFHCVISGDEDTILFSYHEEGCFSGLLAYSLFETYGLPLDIIEDEVCVDREGFRLLSVLAREKNKRTYKNKDAFGGNT